MVVVKTSWSTAIRLLPPVPNVLILIWVNPLSTAVFVLLKLPEEFAVNFVTPPNLPTIVREPVVLTSALESAKYSHTLFSLNGTAPTVPIVKPTGLLDEACPELSIN